MIKDISEYAFDLHAGLSSFQIPELDDLTTLGMAATLAIHLKGLAQVEYEVLRKVSDHFMGIPGYALDKPLRILSDIEFVKLIEDGRRIKTVIPLIPLFTEVYGTLNTFAKDELRFNSHEEALVTILSSLRDAPKVKESLASTAGIDRPLFDQCMKIGTGGGLLSQHLARGRTVLISPFYFTDNLDSLADAAVAVGANSIKSTLDKVRNNQGWPMSLIASRQEIGGNKLSSTELGVINKLSSEGVLRPPTIKFGATSESFVFTPKPGRSRLNAANREIYERAMALISATRKGQLLADNYKIRSPVAILRSLRDNGYLRANSEAANQYANLVMLRVAYLKPHGYGHQLHLNPAPENKDALTLAISILTSGSMAGMEVDKEARIALSKDETYIQSLISAKQLKERQKQIENEEANHEFEQLLLRV